jgi:hypothetical protein
MVDHSTETPRSYLPESVPDRPACGPAKSAGPSGTFDKNAGPSGTTTAPAAPSADALALAFAETYAALAAAPTDEVFCADLLSFIQSHRCFAHRPDPLEHRGILARLYALPDTELTPLLMTAATPEYVGLDLLFDERVLPRLARLRRGHLRGTFLPYARRLTGFAEHDFLRELRQVQQALKSGEASRGTPVVISMDTVTRTPIVWLWYPYIALGKLAMLDGDPGMGKSLLMAQIAANLSKGHPLPNQEGVPTFPTGQLHVTVMLATEDGLADTIKSRLEDAGADCSKVKVLTGWKTDSDEHRAFSFQDMPILEQVLEEHDPRLVIIDPIQAYLGGSVDMHRANETRPLLEALRRLAEAYNCAIVCVRHPAKSSQGGKAIHRGLGSVDFIGAARTGLFVEQHPLDPFQVLLTQSKSNIGPLGRTQIFGKEDGQFRWAGVSRLSAEVLAGCQRGADPQGLLEACCWLEAHLEGQAPLLATQVEKDAQDEDIKSTLLRRAKKVLGVRSTKDGDVWYWHLPGLRLIPQPDPLLSLASLMEPLVDEHLPMYQAVSGAAHEDIPDLQQPREDEAPQPGEDGYAPPTEVVENMEDVQETREEQEAEGPPPASTPPVPTLPMFCPHCHRRPTWLDRGRYYLCSNGRCGHKVCK